MYEKYIKHIDTNGCSVIKWNHEVRGMKKIIELSFVFLIGAFFIVALALRVREIDKEFVSNTSVASNYTVNISNYE